MTARLTLSLLAVLALHLVALGEQPRGWKESKDDRGYVKALVEIKGQLSPIPDAKANDPTGGFVRVGDGFGLQVFRLDWSEAPELREKAKKLEYAWVVLTGRLQPPGSNYVQIGYSGTVTVKTLQVVIPPLRRGPPQQPPAKPKGDRLAKPIPIEVDGRPLVRERGGLFPFVGDFYGDGRLALLLGYGGGGICDGGRLVVYRNVGTQTRPRLGKAQWFDDRVPTGRIPTGSA